MYAAAAGSVSSKKSVEVNHVPTGVARQGSRGWCFYWLIAFLLSLSRIELSELDELRTHLRKQRSKLVLWRRPLTTLHYFLRELLFETHRLAVGYVYNVDVCDCVMSCVCV